MFLFYWAFRFYWNPALTCEINKQFLGLSLTDHLCRKLWWYFEAEDSLTAILWHICSSLHSLEIINELMDQSYDEAFTSVSEDAPASKLNQFPERLPGVKSQQTSTRVKTVLPSLTWALPSNAPKKVRRARNTHTGARGGHHHHHHHPHHGQLMRVGCVLGTCQVQNLSHRLYQLIGQSGREDSSPINPRSPHSFGWMCRQEWSTHTASLY